MDVTLEDLHARADFLAARARVEQALVDALGDDRRLLTFFGRYIDWNGWFGAGVATLASEVARSRRLFVDADEEVAVCSDRSVHVASYFFDAARDEFDDSATPHRDSHRTLAQASVKGMAAQLGLLDEANELLTVPAWLDDLGRDVLIGYGHLRPETRTELFEAMGFHLGSEILADEEFSLLDQGLRVSRPQLVSDLLSLQVSLAGESHPAYYWIGIHSGHGGGVEAEHFEWAVAGVREALTYTPATERAAARESVLQGFDRFAALHRIFFERVNA
jgi:hypothetical protein